MSDLEVELSVGHSKQHRVKVLFDGFHFNGQKQDLYLQASCQEEQNCTLIKTGTKLYVKCY